jgi:hypothetical protein
MGRTGRKPIPIEPYIDKLEQAILIGATYELAAMYAGISQRTFARWRAQAETAKEGTPLAALRNRLIEAEGRAAIGWLAKIERAANEGNWQAASWKLERRYPEQFGRTFSKVAFTDPTGAHPAEVAVIYLPSKAPSAEQWEQDVKHLAPPMNGQGHEAEREP